MDGTPRLVVYCLLDPAHADALEDVRAHYRAADPRVEVIVDRRGRERREPEDEPLPGTERRGARDRRRFFVPRVLAGLPQPLAERAGPLRWAQQMLPVADATLRLADEQILAAIRAGDAEAPTELYWRWYRRMHSRLVLLTGDPQLADGYVAEAFGRVLDALADDAQGRLPLELLVYGEVDACGHALARLHRREDDVPPGGLGLSDPRLDEPVEIREYRKIWVTRARVERDRLLKALGDRVVAVEHFGATAIPDAFARPIVDLLAGVSSLPVDPAALALLGELGYEDCGDGGTAGRAYLRRRGTSRFDLHIVTHGETLWNDALGLRDHLRHNPTDALRWSTVRRDAARTSPGSSLRYFDLRRLALEDLLKQARRESRRLSRWAAPQAV